MSRHQVEADRASPNVAAALLGLAPGGFIDGICCIRCCDGTIC